MAAKYEVKVAHEVPPGTTASFQEFTLPKPFALVALRDECKNILGLGNDFPLYIVDHAGDKVLLRDDRHLQSKLARFSPETQDLKFWVGAASGPPPVQLSAELDMRIKALDEREKALEIREKELNSRNANVAHSQITAPSPVKSAVSRDRISSNRSDTASSRAWWDSNVSHMPLSTAVITASPWIGQTHTRFLRELFAAIAQPADTIKKYPLPASDTALGWTALEKRLGPKILALQGRNEASWQSEVANPLFKEPLHEFFNNQEEYLYLLADPSLHFRADLAVAQRIIDTTADPKLPAYENWRVQWESVKMASTCVAPWLQLEVKRDHGDVRAEIKCKLAMQLLVAREYQEKIVDKLVKLRGSKEEKLEHRTYLQFPWAIGALLDDKGVEFIYMSAEHEDSRRCVYTDLLTWDKLQSIFAVIAVLRVYAHLFWDELLTYVHALVRIPGQPPARRSPSSLSSGSPDSTAFAPFLARPSVPIMFAAHSSKSSSGFAHSPERKRVRAMPPQVTLSSDLTAMEGRVCTCTVGADQVCVKLFDQALGGAQEWRILASLRDRCSAEKSHHFVQLVGWTQLNGRFALVTRRVVCRTRHFRCSSLQEMLCYGASLCEALGELHRLNIIHGDVKPSNALWDVEEGCVKLIDFGNAVFGPEWHGDIGGTDGFRAPESGSRATFATDVYSAGRTLGLVFSDYNEALLDLIASSATFESWLQRAARRSIRVPASLLQSAAASQAFTVIYCMLAADPKQRPVAEKCAKSLIKILRRLH